MSADRPATPSPPSDSRHPAARFPWPIRALASLQLAVVLIALYAVVLAWATFVESHYGTPTVGFFVYGAWWFEALNLLLALNVLLSALVRWPWRRRHIGFLVTHAGVIMLLLGFFVGNRWGIDSQLAVFESQASHQAMRERMGFHLAVLQGEASASDHDGPTASSESIDVPFQPGPFAWERYRRLFWFPWHAVSHDRGTLYDRDGIRLDTLDYVPEGSQGRPPPMVELRLTVDGNSERFELAALPYGIDPDPSLPERFRRVVTGDGRRVAVTLPREMLELGFRVHLHDFRRKLDPGSEKVSHYSSLVDFIARDDGNRALAEDVLITLNAPVNITDPRTGRSYRLYQSSYRGPFRPGQPEFEAAVDGSAIRDEVYQSYLSVNYDPGRGLKYFGSLLISVGIVMTFYSRGFFVPRGGKGGGA